MHRLCRVAPWLIDSGRRPKKAASPADIPRCAACCRSRSIQPTAASTWGIARSSAARSRVYCHNSYIVSMSSRGCRSRRPGPLPADPHSRGRARPATGSPRTSRHTPVRSPGGPGAEERARSLAPSRIQRQGARARSQAALAVDQDVGEVGPHCAREAGPAAADRSRRDRALLQVFALSASAAQREGAPGFAAEAAEGSRSRRRREGFRSRPRPILGPADRVESERPPGESGRVRDARGGRERAAREHRFPGAGIE